MEGLRVRVVGEKGVTEEDGRGIPGSVHDRHTPRHPTDGDSRGVSGRSYTVEGYSGSVGYKNGGNWKPLSGSGSAPSYFHLFTETPPLMTPQT